MNFSQIRTSHFVYFVWIIGMAVCAKPLLYAAESNAESTYQSLAAGTRPNIIVIMTDDLEEGSLDDAIAAGLMPALQNIFVKNGIKFANSFVTNSLCCPSRATFLSGKYTHNHGVLGNLEPYGFPAFDDSSTLATWLSQAGYQTGFIGKYLNEYTAIKDLNGDGSIDESEMAYVPPGWHNWQGLIDPDTYKMYNYKLLNSITGEFERYQNIYQTDLLAQKAMDFIESLESTQDEAPFFLYLSTVAPHNERLPNPEIACPVGLGLLYSIRPAPRHKGNADGLVLPTPSSFNEPDVSDKPAWLQLSFPHPLRTDQIACMELVYRDRIESLQAVDGLIAKIKNILDLNGESNTVLLFTSDNGYLLGEHRISKKTYAYEEAIRVPLYLRDLSSSGKRVIESVVLNNDLAPTIAELAGAATEPDVDGRSFLPLLGPSEPTSWRKRFLVEHFKTGNPENPVPEYAAIRVLSSTDDASSLYVAYKPVGSQENQWGECLPGYCEFYNLKSDPLQETSLHDKAELQPFFGDLNRLVNRFQSCVAEQCRNLEDGNFSGN